MRKLWVLIAILGACDFTSDEVRIADSMPCNPDASEITPDGGVDSGVPVDAELTDAMPPPVHDALSPDAYVVDCNAWDAGYTCSVDYPECWPSPDQMGELCDWWNGWSDAGS